MNIRKPIDYTSLFRELDVLILQKFPQMRLYQGIGKLVSDRREKGAAVAAAEYLQRTYPNTPGFSPRSVRRMRDFYRTYQSNSALMKEALRLGWSQNIVILENCPTDAMRAQYPAGPEHTVGQNPNCWRKLPGAKMVAILSTRTFVRAILRAKTTVRRKPMKKILFICHGNICRSPMAEFVMKDLVEKAGLSHQFEIASAATSQEELGNPVYPPARKKLAEHGISCKGKTARQLTNGDYDAYDLLIYMDEENRRGIYQICGGDYADKVRRLLDFTAHPRDVADPWYTGDFDATWRDVEEGCRALLEQMRKP
ncbi:Low molecular weight phosphotyrosine protein phosphatase [anaerobic digester metagenome]